MITERDIVLALARGDLPSPTEFYGSKFYRVRVSGTGAAWRSNQREFCYRDPRIFLSDRMCHRVCGLPLIVAHPKEKMLNGDSLAASIVGVLLYGYVQDDSLWGIARIIDERTCELLDAGEFDTSPSVLFDPADNVTVPVNSGDKLLIEGEPALLDHVAIVPKGVWTRGGEAGVEISERKA